MNNAEAKTETTNSLIVQKVFDYVSKYFVIIAGSLSGTTGLFTALGFLAERSHLTMLGFTVIPINLELYLYTGAKFVAYLPIILITAFGLIIINAWQIFMVLAIVLILWGIFKRFKTGTVIKNVIGKFSGKAKYFLFDHLSGTMFIFLVFQLVALFQMFLAVRITDLLFESSIESPVKVKGVFNEGGDVKGIFAGTGELKSWIINNNASGPIEYIGKLFILIAILGLILWLLIDMFRNAKDIKLNFWQNFWLGGSILVFLTQLILLPVNYGILLLPNNFTVVEVSFAEDYKEIFSEYEANNSATTLPRNKRLTLLHQDGDTFYLYYRNDVQPMVLYVKENRIQSLVYIGSSNIFEVP